MYMTDAFKSVFSFVYDPHNLSPCLTVAPLQAETAGTALRVRIVEEDQSSEKPDLKQASAVPRSQKGPSTFNCERSTVTANSSQPVTANSNYRGSGTDVCS